ncbi:MAG: hypothetical protein ACXADY_23970 [Candidatus Hodarchaeales archaeon]|jgi:hypothetical protein
MAEPLDDPELLLNIWKELETRIKNEGNNATLIFLCGISSLLLHNGGVNAIIEGASSAGKSYVAEEVLLEHFPEVDSDNPDAWGLIIANHLTFAGLTRLAMHLDKKIIYQGELNESSTEENKQVEQALRQVISGGRYVRYLTNERTKQLEKLEIKGKPTCVSTTASLKTELQLSNRYIKVNLDETQRQTEVIVDFIFEHDFNKPSPGSQYIKEVIAALVKEFEYPAGPVYNPYAKSIARILNEKYSNDVHLRRVASQVKNIINTITLLHVRQRQQVKHETHLPKIFTVATIQDNLNTLYLLNEVIDQSISKLHKTSVEILEIIVNNYGEGVEFTPADIADKSGYQKTSVYPKLRNLHYSGYLEKSKEGRRIKYSWRKAKPKSSLIVDNTDSTQLEVLLLAEDLPDGLSYDSELCVKESPLLAHNALFYRGKEKGSISLVEPANCVESQLTTIRVEYLPTILGFIETNDGNSFTFKDIYKLFKNPDKDKINEILEELMNIGYIYMPKPNKFKIVG